VGLIYKWEVRIARRLVPGDANLRRHANLFKNAAANRLQQHIHAAAARLPKNTFRQRAQTPS
jgi:hypothetical protein